MSMTISDTIRAFVIETFYTSPELRDDDSLLDTGTMDSTGVLELIAFVEQTWGIAVGEREILPDNFDSIGRIALYIERKLKARSESAAPLSPPASPLPSHP